MNKYSRKHVFDTDGNLLPIEQRTFTTNEGYELVLINGGTTEGSVIYQIDEHIYEGKLYQIKKGSIKNPFHPRLSGVGYCGIGPYPITTIQGKSKEYKIWCGMLARAYDEEQRSKYPTYKDVTVHPDWHNYQTFAKWVNTTSNYQLGWQLDKDLLAGSSKIYSPSTCIFIPPQLNKFMTNIKSTNTSGYPGVRWHKRDLVWEAQIKSVITDKIMYLGRFSTAEEADIAYKTVRVEQCLVWVNRMQGILPQAALDGIH